MAGPHSGKLHPLLRDCLAAIGHEDDPQDRSPPANVTILRAVAEALDLGRPLRRHLRPSKTPTILSPPQLR